MKPQAADGFASMASAYVHIPFCSAVCPYCDFAVVAGQDELAGRYIHAVCAEIREAQPWRPLDAIYLGGGTPSHIEPSLLADVISALDEKHGIADGAEVSLEANPEDFDSARARRLLDAGFNRVSFGAQSLDEAVLLELGRRHTPDRVVSSVASARDAGFENVSIDLIYGSAAETDGSWRATLAETIELKPDHVSCYALTVERGTALGRAVRGGADGPDPDTQADRYLEADATLSAAGFERYEVSNWSKPGRECRYNLTVWAQGEYEAYGNGAHGFRNGRRYRNHRRLDAYIARVEAGRSPRAGQDRLDSWDTEVDRVFVGLRRTVGVASGEGTRILLDSDDGRALLDAGVIAEENDRLIVLKPLLTDAVHRSVLSEKAPIVGGDGDA